MARRIEKMLQPGERVLHRTPSGWRAQFSFFLSGGFVLVLTAAVLWWIFDPADPSVGNLLFSGLFGTIGIFIVFAISVAILSLPRAVLTDRRLLWTTEPRALRIAELPLRDIAAVERATGVFIVRDRSGAEQVLGQIQAPEALAAAILAETGVPGPPTAAERRAAAGVTLPAGFTPAPDGILAVGKWNKPLITKGPGVLLQPGEQMRFRIERSFKSIAVWFVAFCSIPLAALVAVPVLFALKTDLAEILARLSADPDKLPLYLSAAALFIVCGVWIGHAISSASENGVAVLVTNRRVLYRPELLATRLFEIPLPDIAGLEWCGPWLILKNPIDGDVLLRDVPNLTELADAIIEANELPEPESEQEDKSENWNMVRYMASFVGGAYTAAIAVLISILLSQAGHAALLSLGLPGALASAIVLAAAPVGAAGALLAGFLLGSVLGTAVATVAARPFMAVGEAQAMFEVDDEDVPLDHWLLKLVFLPKTKTARRFTALLYGERI